MSNQLVGTIYARIMQEVLETARVDFEEGGVDQSTLDELKEMWQAKLSFLHVAPFPWEPTPAPTQISNPPTVPSNVHTQQQLQQQRQPQPAPAQVPPSSISPTVSSNNVGGARIKSEPGYEGGQTTAGGSAQQPQSNATNPALNNPQTAAQRAANLMQQKFGNQANNSIGALQSGLVLPGSKPGTQSPVQPQNGQPQSTQAQPLSQQRLPASQESQPEQQRPNAAPPQTDGSGDSNDEWSAVMVQRNAQGEQEELGRVEVDGMIRRRVEEMGLRMEGGGLMVPLSERPRISRGKRRRRIQPEQGEASSSSSALPPVVPHPSGASSLSRVAAYDGGVESDSDEKIGIKDEDDADAINSDLDDPDDNIDEEPEEEEGLSQIMLCMYDKVQRVKNKWKCVLKDGVLQVNGKEYLFHKATGEFEW